MRISKTKNQYIEVPLWFIKDYMPKAPSGYTHVYLYLLALSYKAQRDISLEKVAKTLKMLYSEVISALGYWSEQGIINFKADSPDEELSFLMQPISDQLSLEGLYGSLMSESPRSNDAFAEIAADEFIENTTNKDKTIATNEHIDKFSPTNNIELKNDSNFTNEHTIKKTHSDKNINSEKVTDSDKSDKIEQTAHGMGFSSISRPNYQRKEIQAYKVSSSEYADLLKYTEQLIGKPLSSEMPNLLYGLYDWLGMDFDVIKCLLKYCHEHNKFNINYIEKTAIGWVEKDGIKTVEHANAKLEEEKQYYKILKALGIRRGVLTTTDKDFIDKWTKTWGFSFETILKACEKTVVSTSNPNLNYTDKILSIWQKENIKTLDAIEVADNAYHAKKVIESDKPKPTAWFKTPIKQTRFNMIDSREWDFDELDRLEEERLDLLISGKLPK